LDADTFISMLLMLVMAISVALSVVLASSEAVVDDDEVFLLTAVSDGGLRGAWITEHIEYFLSNLRYPATGSTMVVGFTVAIVLAIGSSSTRDGALSQRAAVEVEEDATFESLYGATCGPACKSSDYTTIVISMAAVTDAPMPSSTGRCRQCRKMMRKCCALALVPVTDHAPTTIGTRL
jgi:hypothetical protein